MKKSIFLFFAAILCAMTANAQWALMGTLTDWSSGKAMTVSGTTATCDVDLTANTTYTLKVKNGSKWYGRNSTTITATTTTSAFSTSGGDVTLKSTFNGTYTFSFNTSTMKLTVTYPTEDKPIETHDITVKAKYPAGWNAGKAAIHFWGNGVASPGTPAAMTKDGDWWTYTVTGVPTTSPLSVIFINGNNWNGDKNQTVDITGITENTCFEVSQSGSAKGLAVEADCETGEAEVIETHDITVKAFYPASWNAGKAAVHFWGDGVASPGTPAAMTKDGDWWTYTVTGVPTTTELSVIFINGNTWNGDANQTVDITGIKESTCYQITSGSGKASAAVVDCASTPATPEPEPTELTYNVTVPAGTKACYIAGDMNTWSFTEMTKVDDTHYTITIEGAKKSDGYKYASGGEWGYVEKDASGNEMGNRTWAENDVVARWASVYDPDAVEQELTYSVTVPEGTYACYIAMDTDPAQEGWEFNEMTKVDETHYKFERTGLKNKTYKYTSGPGWEYVEKTAEDGEVADRQWAENDVVAKWTSVYNPTAPTYDYYLTGSLVGGWDVKQQGIEKDGELYKVTFNALAAGTYEFKITAGDWEHQWNYNNLGAAYEEVSQGVDGEGNPNGNIKIVTEEAKNITVIFDGSKITFEGLTPYVAPLTYTVTVPAGTEKCYIAGAFAQSNWNTFLEMEQVVGEDKFTITITGAKETDEYKYACQADWAYAEVIDGGGNRTNWSELDEVEKWGKPAVPTLMGVDGDWTTGIEMTINPDKADEYILLGQSIASETTVKIKYGDTWCAALEETSAGTIVKDAMDQDNISLAAGTYDFYYKKNDNKVWIGVCTPAIPTPDYTREGLTEGDLGTICLPSNVPSGKASGATFYTLAGRDANGKIVFNEILSGELEAGKPYLFQATATEIVCFYGTESVTEPDNSGAMKGTFVEKRLTGSDLTNIYYFAQKALWSCVDLTELEVPANRAYVDMDDMPAISESNLAPGVRRITLGVNGQQVATGMENIDASAQPVKAIINGQLFILRGEKMYDAQGKLVK